MSRWHGTNGRATKMADEGELLLLLLLRRRRRRRRERERESRQRCCWIRDIFRRRKEQGDFHNMVRELQLADREFYFSFYCRTKRQG